MIRIAEPLIVARHSPDAFSKKYVLNEGLTPRQVSCKLKNAKNKKHRKAKCQLRTKKKKY